MLQPKDYLTLHLHRNNKDQFERVWYPGKSGGCVLTGVYTNNPHVLIRYDIDGNDDNTSLFAVLSQYKKSNDLGYTLSCYCTEAFALCKPPTELEYCEEKRSEWSSRTCGGPIGNPQYNTNPMFPFKVPEGGSIVQFTVATASASAVNILCLPVLLYGDTIDKAIGEPVIDSGNYRHGFVVTKRTKLKAGAYTAVVSNFYNGEQAVFILNIFSSSKLQIKQL